MKTLTIKGHNVFFDDLDEVLISKYTWYLHKSGTKYYCRGVRYKNHQKVYMYMHRLLLGPEKGILIDHIDGNGLNNVRSNIRLCNSRQNGINSRLKKNNSTGYRGVCFHKAAKKYEAYIKQDQGKLYLGLFDTKEKAAIAYNTAASQHYGEFAILNQI